MNMDIYWYLQISHDFVFVLSVQFVSLACNFTV